MIILSSVMCRLSSDFRSLLYNPVNLRNLPAVQDFGRRVSGYDLNDLNDSYGSRTCELPSALCRRFSGFILSPVS